MESKDELKEIDIKNRTCCYFDDIIKVQVFILVILLDEKLYKIISVYDISNKTTTDPKPLCIRLDKIDGFVRIRGDEFRYLVLLNNGLFDKFCDEIKYLIKEKSGIIDSINHSFGRSELIHIIF